MSPRRLYLVKGRCPFTGSLGEWFWAADAAAARRACCERFGLQALTVEGEK